MSTKKYGSEGTLVKNCVIVRYLNVDDKSRPGFFFIVAQNRSETPTFSRNFRTLRFVSTKKYGSELMGKKLRYSALFER